MRILKFGGSSVGTPERIKDVIDILKEYYSSNKRYSVIFSAFQGVTDSLISISKKAECRDETVWTDFEELKNIHNTSVKYLLSGSNATKVAKTINILFEELKEILHGIYLLRELTSRSSDYVVSFGERLSCSIICEAMKFKGIDCEFLDSREIIKTDSTFGNAKVNFELTNNIISSYFSNHNKVQVITGFISSTQNNETTTLGRGGSDYTASIIGAALNCQEIEIWTDVDGILTADPRKVKNAFSLNSVTYEEAMEMSHFGAKVIHPPTMKPALLKNIPIRIKNTFRPSFEGTVITEKDVNSNLGVKGISSIDEITLLRVTGSGMVGVVGIASRIFGALAKEKINVILITQASSEHSVCFAVMPQAGAQAKTVIEEEFKWEMKDGMIDAVIVEPEMSIIAVVGENMRHTPGISGKVFRSLGNNKINIIAIAQGSSELNISLVINKEDLKKAMNVLHNSLFKQNKDVVNVFLIGSGLVGSALLSLLHQRKKYVTDRYNTSLNLCGLLNSKKMFINPNGIAEENWKNILSEKGEKSDIELFIKAIQQLNLPKTILVDCTANNSVVNYYPQILSSNISIVTPNKIANTQSYSKYLLIREAEKNSRAEFRYGTNVGSALPLIATLKDILLNGDEVYKIEGIFSGTLSFIFNTLKEKDSFSQIVKGAKELGYTEPDPRDDLGGKDMARKLLILIRECGYKLEMEDIEIEKIISKEAEDTATVDEFFEILKNDDKKIIALKNIALQKDCVLAYIAKFENGKAGLSIQTIPKSHPFSNLTNSENIVAFTTKNYFKNPLILRGQGAGADFTATGILSDILRISNKLE